jgi:hypothetical protein
MFYPVHLSLNLACQANGLTDGGLLSNSRGLILIAASALDRRIGKF